MVMRIGDMFIGDMFIPFPCRGRGRVEDPAIGGRRGGLVSSFDTRNTSFEKDSLQKRYNFDGDSDRRHVSRELNWSVPL
jgi:hypothetical protein